MSLFIIIPYVFSHFNYLSKHWMQCIQHVLNMPKSQSTIINQSFFHPRNPSQQTHNMGSHFFSRFKRHLGNKRGASTYWSWELRWSVEKTTGSYQKTQKTSATQPCDQLMNWKQMFYHTSTYHQYLDQNIPFWWDSFTQSDRWPIPVRSYLSWAPPDKFRWYGKFISPTKNPCLKKGNFSLRE